MSYLASLHPFDFLVIALQVAAAVLYAVVGTKVGRRRVSTEAMLAVKMFRFWWYGLAALSAISPVLVVGQAAVGNLPIPVWVAVVDAFLVLICLAFMGLVYYLLYLYTGRRWLIWPVAIFYGALAFGLLALVAFMNPQEPFVGEGTDRAPTYENEITGTPLSAALGLLFIVPPFGAAVAYGLLYFRIHDRTARYRIAMVSLSFVGWFGSSLVAQFLGVRTQDNDLWRIASMAVSLTAAVTVLLAYLPPTSWQRRWGLESIAGEGSG